MKGNGISEFTYCLVVLGQEGMYTHGDAAANPDLAKLVPGAMRRGDGRLGIKQSEWGYNDRDQPVVIRSVIVEAETYAGEWVIGV